MTFNAHGKLLLTGEYAVLDGALALALPTRLGQTMKVTPGNVPGMLSWFSYDHRQSIWFFADVQLPQLAIMGNSDTGVGKNLHKVLLAARKLNPDFLQDNKGIEVNTWLEFDRHWGLGTSSTFVHCVAQWAGIDPYQLLQLTFGGSGYDIACASAEGPILYKLEEGEPVISSVDFYPEFRESLFFVYLESKQDTREAIGRYRDISGEREELVKQISRLTTDVIRAGNLSAFEEALMEHEGLLAQVLQLPTVQDRFFHDYWGVTKSLGAWGGDFALATSDRSIPATKEYFHNKGFTTVLAWDELILP
jgi:mevalonate kinase